MNVEHTAEVTAHPELGAAVRHLVRNGFEHNTSERPRVEVTVTDTDDGPTVEVADNGPGIAPSEVEILEEHRESALEHGSGAGLWIVDRVIEYSDALLEFERTDGTRATITVSAGAPSADPSSDPA
jgi:signal transduction histidine kinase